MVIEKKTIRNIINALWIILDFFFAFVSYLVFIVVIGYAFHSPLYTLNAFFILRFSLMALFCGLSVAFADIYLVKGITRLLSFLPSLLIGTLLYLFFALCGVFLYVVVEGLLTSGFTDTLFEMFSKLSLFVEGELLVFIVFLLIASYIINGFHLVVRRIGEKSIWDAIIGRYFVPHEEERIFMFIDLHDSTALAEKLGHAAYHDLLYELFNDISLPISEHSGEIYQYVGDAVVITWDIPQGIRRMNCIECFFGIQHKIRSLTAKYLQAYQFYPQFRAGMHAGKVIAGEVGEVKREIVYHGDTVNTAARIQSECSLFQEHFLISESLIMLFPVEELNKYKTEFIGCIKLKGKIQDVCLYSINEHDPMPVA